MKIRKIPKLILTLFTLLTIAITSSNPAFAGVLFSVSPASGSYTTSQNIALNVMFNANGSNTTGVSITYTFSGPVTFLSSAAGTVDCGLLFVVDTPDSTTVTIECADLDNLPSGSIAVLTFDPTSTGTFTITSSATDGGGVAVDGSTGGSYSITTPVSGGGGSNGDGDTLPSTADIQSIIPIVVGSFLIVVSLVLWLSQYNWAYILDKRRGFETRFNSTYSEDDQKA
ncbi:MAG: hypothetical protein Fur003_5750 [Candidatus Dojkabacteria bacterium]